MPPPPFPVSTTDPSSVYRVRDAIYAADLLTAGLVHLDLFSLLAARPMSLEEVCRSLALAPRPADVMLTLFAAMGLIEKHGAAFGATALAREHLAKGSPWFLGPYYASFKDRPVCQDLLQVLRTGKPASWASLKSEKDWAAAMEDPGFAERFTGAMDCRGAYLGPAVARSFDFAAKAKLLDIAGGSGIYACAVAAGWPHMRATVLEKPPVDRVAAAMIAKRGFADRVSVVSADMFSQPLPGGFDVHLFSNVLHDWDEPAVRSLIRKSHDALPPGGSILIHDAHLNAEKTGPIEVAEYSVLLMHATEGRCYSTAEIEAYLADAGFRSARHVPTAAGRSLIEARRD